MPTFTHSYDLNKCVFNPCLSNIDRVVENIDSSLSSAAHISSNIDATNNDIILPEVDEQFITSAIIDSSVKNKQANMWGEILDSSDSKCLWNRIDWNGSSTSILNDSPEIDDLVDHFKGKGQSSDDSTLLCEVTGNRYVPVLDKYIVRDEVKVALNRLKHDKATGD